LDTDRHASSTRETSVTWDLLLKGGTVFDGHGGPPRREDLAIAAGRVVARGGDLPEGHAHEVIDVTGRWVLPGLLDIHTHVDLEVELDPGLSEVVRHGTTTTVMSNCSLGLAFGNQRTAEQDPIVDCFARVENIPKPVLEAVADKADWTDPAGYLGHLEALPLGANVVPLVPHSMLRTEVMGLAGSISRDPSEHDVAEMERLLDEALANGYAGFSTDALPFHYLANDPHRRERIPTQWTTREELSRLVEVLRRHDRVWQATPPKDSPKETLETFLLARGRGRSRPVRLTAVAALDVASNRSLLKLAKTLTRAMNSAAVGGHFRMQALAAPFKVWGDGPITPQFEEVEPLRRLNEPDLDDVEARRAILDDPAWQAWFREVWMLGKDGRGIAGLKRRLRIEDFTITRDLDDMVVDGAGAVAAWDGDTLGEVLRRADRFQRTGAGAKDDEDHAAFEAMPRLHGDEVTFLVHVLRTYDTSLRWFMISANQDPAGVREVLFDEQFLPGFNDSGAHLTNMAFYDANLRGLQLAQRDGLARVATHVRRLTRDPAEFFRLEVGTLDVGARADVAVVDPEALARWDTEATTVYQWRDAFEHEQVVNRPPNVVTHTLVGGSLVWADGEATPTLGVERAGDVLTVR
jgi:N-acyl-D-aspartate/D-glutamate deacylase